MPILQQPAELIALLMVLSLLPLIVVMGTSFLKLTIVFALLRNALGIQQIPPNMALYGLGLILTLYIMTPVCIEVKNNLDDNSANPQASLLTRLSDNTLDPYKKFLARHTAEAQLRFFRDKARKNWPEDVRKQVADDSLFILMPAFTVTQLIEGFKIGLLLFLPFIAIDLIVSNILLAMGMMMVSPMTISMPFKLLIFVLVGGWDRLLDQLLLSYHG